jgi:uncharacterized protein involved in exopolysaccharide biosynthesis
MQNSSLARWASIADIGCSNSTISLPTYNTFSLLWKKSWIFAAAAAAVVAAAFVFFVVAEQLYQTQQMLL